jgi:hypothetical protein
LGLFFFIVPAFFGKPSVSVLVCSTRTTMVVELISKGIACSDFVMKTLVDCFLKNKVTAIKVEIRNQLEGWARVDWSWGRVDCFGGVIWARLELGQQMRDIGFHDKGKKVILLRHVFGLF